MREFASTLTNVHRRAVAADDQHVWTSVRPLDEVLADADSVTRRVARGEHLPLAGLTFGVKDNIDVAGLPTTAAHPSRQQVPDISAPCVRALVAAGAIVIGKTNMDQFATGLVGTRSPFGAVASARDPRRVAGGSSSGSAAVVALGLVDFALGTDTAGSGRVPAAFNGIVGVKPTLGMISGLGVVPASPSYDTVSVFARDVDLAARVTALLIDPSGRPWPADVPQAAPNTPRVAIPDEDALAALDTGLRPAWDDAVARATSLGWVLTPIDMTVFLEAARLLYDGGLLVERGWSFGRFLAEHPDGADPVVASIGRRAMEVTGIDVVDAQRRLVELTRRGLDVLREHDVLMIPTAPVHPTSEAVAADPINLNARVGTYTNFVNLMDLCAVAVPAGTAASAGLFGVSLVAPAGHDQVVCDLAARFLDEGLQAPHLGQPGLDVAVFGAHLSGEPLNADLEKLGGRLMGPVATAPSFRMLVVPGPVERPAVVRADDGANLPGELWRIPLAGVASLLSSIAAPLALGPVELADGRMVIGFLASTTNDLRDITDLGGWRSYRASIARTTPLPA